MVDKTKKTFFIYFDPVTRFFYLDNGLQDTPFWQSVSFHFPRDSFH